MSDPVEPPVAADVFGARLPLARRYAAVLADAATVRGLIGPREVPRLWDRHLLNCAVVTDLVPPGARVVDVGSGAGLPGLVFAVRRPDLRVDLVESLQRRVDFLEEVVGELGLDDQVRVVRGRAEDPAVSMTVGGADVVTARAVAPLDRLVRWCLPLVAPGGRLLALKGATARAELDEHAGVIRRSGGTHLDLVECGSGIVEPATSVVVVRRDEADHSRSAAGPSARRVRGRAGGRGQNQERTRHE